MVNTRACKKGFIKFKKRKIDFIVERYTLKGAITVMNLIVINSEACKSTKTVFMLNGAKVLLTNNLKNIFSCL